MITTLKRSRLELKIDVLRALSTTKPMIMTHIIYRTQIMHSTMKQILGELKNKELIKTTPRKPTWHGNPKEGFLLTFKGVDVLRRIEKAVAEL